MLHGPSAGRTHVDSLTGSILLVQVLTSTKDIEMWGDGLQTRSFTFIDDCVEGILRITKSDYKEPLNLGSSEMVRPHTLRMLQIFSTPSEIFLCCRGDGFCFYHLGDPLRAGQCCHVGVCSNGVICVVVQVSMNEMMETIKTFDNKELPIRHIPGPEGVRGRNSDNALILEKLGWEPTIRLADGLRVTYQWIKSQLEEVRTRRLTSQLPAHAAF